MEQGIKENILALNTGVSNTPSDLVCDDGSLEVFDGLVSVDGEWKAVQKPGKLMDGVGTLMLVHEVNGGKHYIWKRSISGDRYMLYYDNESQPIGGMSFAEIKKVTAIGNILIANTDAGLHYWLWSYIDVNGTDKWSYKYLGDRIPEPDVEFTLGSLVEKTAVEKDIYKTFEDTSADDDTRQMDANNAFIGRYEEAKAKVEEEMRFATPFFVRAAVELHDGSYTLATAPVLLFPNIRIPATYMYTYDYDNHRYADLEVSVYGAPLLYKLGTDYSDWSDIVKGVHIFVTRGVSLADTSVDVDTRQFQEYMLERSHITYGKYEVTESPEPKYYPYIPANWKAHIRGIQKKTDLDLRRDLANERVYYKLCEIKSSETFREASFDKYKIKNIEVQEQLTNADFFSHCPIVPGNIIPFNRRLNAWNVDRGFFKGFKQFMPYVQGLNNVEPSDKTYVFAVDINTNSGKRTVLNEYTTKDIVNKFTWFYYPDPRAKRLEVFEKRGDVYYSLFETTLTEHPGLNGAYNELFMIPSDERKPDGDVKVLPYENTTPEHLGNYVLQSEVDNPFTFAASGYTRVGQGEVIGLAGLTTALNQDAYKVATTLAFTTQGIWALQINNEGQYMQVTPPFSREVCENGDTITMTDDAVFFVSKKGLMMVVGTSESSVICVSEQMRGKGFKDFYDDIKDALIAYDYRDGLLMLFSPTAQLSDTGAWIYNIKGRSWSTCSGYVDIVNVVNDYPDNILQGIDNKCYSLLEKPFRDEDVNTYNCVAQTRPLKLQGATILKSLRQIKHMMLVDKSKMNFTVKGSNDLKTWNNVTSTSGRSWKFFRFRYEFTGLNANDTYAGTIAVTQARYQDKIR